MGKKYEQLSLEERCTIATLSKQGLSIRQIGTALARSPSTISRELTRNRTKTHYEPAYANLRATGRRWTGSRLERQADLRNTVLDRLAMGWSPQQVSHRLAQEQGYPVISHESIYRFIDTKIRQTKDYSWRHYLPRGKSKRGYRGRAGGSSAAYIKQRNSIHTRPEILASRDSVGHWEVDLMGFSAQRSPILVLQERFSRVVILFKLKDKQAKPIGQHLVTFFKQLPSVFAQTATFDNGSEFSQHVQLQNLGMNTYFCDVSSPWQKGGVENAIGRLRRILPRKILVDDLAKIPIHQVAACYNHTPRKCLGYKTPAEIFFQQLLHFKCELTFPSARE